MPDKGPSPHPSMRDIKVSTSGIQKLLEQVKPNKASGPDQIPARVLKECASELAHILKKTFTKTLQLGNVPKQWREVYVTPIFKTGD